MILGQNFMRHIGINKFIFTDTIWWIDWSVKMKLPHHYDLMTMTSPIDEDFEDKEVLPKEYAELIVATEILDQA